jgi:hypothetical protein
LKSQLEVVKRFNEPAAAFHAAEIPLAVEFLHKKETVHK